jgi:hypothetical protein
MSNHRARTWDHRGSKHLGPKLLPLGHHLDGGDRLYLIIKEWRLDNNKKICIYDELSSLIFNYIRFKLCIGSEILFDITLV